MLTAGILPTALAIPSTDSVVHGYRIAMTPDRLLGRAESVAQYDRVADRAARPAHGRRAAQRRVGARDDRRLRRGRCSCSRVWGTLSPSIRTAPSLDDLSKA